MHPVQSNRATGSDAFTHEVIRNKLLAIASEMGIVLARTSMSPIVYEVLDFACGITDTEARVIAQDNGLCLFTGTFRPQVESILRRHPVASMRPGDVFMTNDPWKGTGHLNDFTMVTPIFRKKRMVALFASTVHVTDIGGMGYGPDALRFCGGARRVLFLVDRSNLGEQAEKEFQAYRVPDVNRKFTELYNVQRLSSNTIMDSSRVVISMTLRSPCSTTTASHAAAIRVATSTAAAFSSTSSTSNAGAACRSDRRPGRSAYGETTLFRRDVDAPR